MIGFADTIIEMVMHGQDHRSLLVDLSFVFYLGLETAVIYQLIRFCMAQTIRLVTSVI